MANFKRRRPRKQPCHVMGSEHRVFGDPRDRTVDEPECNDPPKPKRKVQKRFGIESRFTGDVPAGVAMLFAKARQWRALRWYETESDRDKAIAAISRKATRWEYRPCQR